jgi:tetratricopeptide (TPR) repeat protein
MLGAGRLIGGAYNVLDEQNLRLDVALAELERDTVAPDLESRSGALAQLFELQTEIVFRVVERLGIELTAEERAAIQYVPTENLQAFLAYSRGLLEEDEGNFEAAANAFQRAREIDPGFERAVESEQRAEGLSAVAGPLDTALGAAVQLEPLPPTINLVDSRLRSLTGTIGAGFVPGQEQRQPAAEGGTFITLDDPPPPPPRGNQ